MNYPATPAPFTAPFVRIDNRITRLNLTPCAQISLDAPTATWTIMGEGVGEGEGILALISLFLGFPMSSMTIKTSVELSATPTLSTSSRLCFPLPSSFCYPHCAFLCHVWSVCLAHLTLQILWQCWKKFLQFVTPNYHNNQTVPLSLCSPNPLSLYISLLIDSTPCWPRRLLYNCRNRCVCSSLCLPWEFALPSLSNQTPHSSLSLLLHIHPHSVQLFSVLSKFYSKRVCLFTVHLRT